MHLFEAFMALDAAGLAMGAARADIFSLFETRFLDRQAGILREFFTDDLAAHDPAKGDLVEPGHMMEWVWLLDRRRRQTGVAAFDIQTLLYRRAIELGEDPAGFLVDQIRLGDRPHGSRRLWPQTEYLKAALVMARQGDKDASSRAERLIDALFQSYLDQNVKGLWCDRYDGSGRPAAQSVPASILYHLMEAALEAERHLREAQ
jgi:mannose-6-phosphate isomerase